MKKITLTPSGRDFVTIFYYWLGRLGVNEYIPFKTDKRINHHGGMAFYSDGSKELFFNQENIGNDWSAHILLSGALHEIGHILVTGKYETEEEKIYEEFRAETFALSIMNYFYLKSFKKVCKYYRNKLKDKEWQKKYPIHYKAFKQIKEYC